MQLALAGRGDDGDVPHPHLWAPPPFVLAVPADRIRKPLLESHARRPAEEPLELAAVAGVPEHLPGTISDELEVRIEVHDAAHAVGDFQDRPVRAEPQL